MKRVARIRRAVSFNGVSRKNKEKERAQRAISPCTSIYTGYPVNSQRGKMALAGPIDCRGTDITTDNKERNIYSPPSLYCSSNYSSSVYSCTTRDNSDKSSEKDGWAGSYDYAIMPRLSNKKSNYSKETATRSTKKHDYQDVYKDHKSKRRVDKSKEPANIEKVNVVEKVAPVLPNRKYSQDDDLNFEDKNEEGPPRIAPFGGYLPKNAGKAVVRPIAFKPVITNKPLPQLTGMSPDNAYDKPHQDDGYSSQESRACSHNGTMRDSYTYELRSEAFHSSPYRESQQPECYQATPSPSDSGVGEYEMMLKDKERELITLRETMEANERVIFQVNEEKRLSWESQMKDLTSEYHRRLRLQQDRAFKSEQELQERITSLKQDNQKLQTEKEQLLILKDRNSHLQEQLKHSKKKNDDVLNKLTQTNSDCELLKQQNKEKHSQVMRLEEQITVIKAENMNLLNELDEKKRAVKKLERQDSNTTTDREISQLEALLAERDAQLKAEREQFNLERELWEQEKKKVLQYQKQLQSNYIQMCRRNSQLESGFSNQRSQNNNNSHVTKKVENTSFKAQLESKPESLC